MPYKGYICIVSLSIAAYLSYKDKEGWGWFIFIAFLCL
jgi:hypothetical protein